VRDGLRDHASLGLLEWLAGLVMAGGFVAVMLWSGPGAAVSQPRAGAFAVRLQEKVHDLRLRALREKRAQRLLVYERVLVHEEAVEPGMAPARWHVIGRILRPEGLDVAGDTILIEADALAVPARVEVVSGEGTRAALTVSRVGLPTVEVYP
jgi:hypothetical protein